jgi:hypothetical protein
LHAKESKKTSALRKRSKGEMMNRMGLAPQPIPPFGREQMRDIPAVRVIPYEYVADFALQGGDNNVGNLVQDVINISVEGVFVAVSIGYGLVEERAEALDLRNKPATLGAVTLADFPPDVLIEGFRLNPNMSAIALQNGQLNTELPVTGETFQRLKSADNFSFLLSIVDTGTGRELQNRPVHSLATLGRPDGQRPFKMLPQPMVFLPRSTIRLQVEERTKGVGGRLFITLQGYKILGLAGALEEETRRSATFDPLKKVPVYDHATGNYRTLGERLEPDMLTTHIVPFDYVSTLDLTGQPGNIVEDEVPINVDGGYVATAITYSLDTGDTTIEIGRDDEPIDLSTIKLTEMRPVQALVDGIRIHPLRTRFAFTAGGQLNPKLSRFSSTDQPRPDRPRSDLLKRIFQSVNRPEEVRFLYSINDTGTGRELQSQRVSNVASLGIANGERPFKVFHKPMIFLPRSTIRVQVEEVFGRGRLFLVFQGYKMLR